MKTALMNFLAGRIGAALAPVILAALASLVAWVAVKVPWLAPHVTLDRALAFVGLVLAAALSLINYLTTARGFKYAEPVQRLVDTLAKQLGLPPLKLDNVIAEKTAATAEVIESAVLKTPRGEPLRLPGTDRPKSAPVGGLRAQRGGFALSPFLFGIASACLLIACAARPERSTREVSLSFFPDVTVTPDLSLPRNFSGAWLQEESDVHAAAYHLPASRRLLYSLRPWAETGTRAFKVRVDEEEATMVGTWHDNRPVRFPDFTPKALAIGFGGGLDF